MGANADTVKNGWDAFARGDMDAATAPTSDSAEIVVPESLPWGGTYTGPDGFKANVQKPTLMGATAAANGSPSAGLRCRRGAPTRWRR